MRMQNVDGMILEIAAEDFRCPGQLEKAAPQGRVNPRPWDILEHFVPGIALAGDGDFMSFGDAGVA